MRFLHCNACVAADTFLVMQYAYAKVYVYTFSKDYAFMHVHTQWVTHYPLNDAAIFLRR